MNGTKQVHPAATGDARPDGKAGRAREAKPEQAGGAR